jgi:hypothetical protein
MKTGSTIAEANTNINAILKKQFCRRMNDVIEK